MKYLGLEITPSSIRAILIKKNTSHYIVIEKKVFPISTVSENDFLKKLVEIKTHFSCEDIKYCIGIESNKCFIRTLQLPFYQKFKLNKILPFQLEEELPIDPTNLATDMLFLNKSTETDSEILVIATKKKELKSLTDNLNALNFNIESIAPTQISLNSLLPQNSDDTLKNNIKIYLSLDFNTCYLNIAEIYNGQYYLTQSTQLNYQVNTLLKNLAKKYSINLEEAKVEFLKTSFIVIDNTLNSVTTEQQEFSQTISTHLQDLTKELKQEFLKLKLKGQNLSSVEIYGEALCIKNLIPFLKQELGTGIKVFQTHLLHPDYSLNIKSQNNESYFTNALSLAISLASPVNQINFLQGELSPTNQKIKNFWIKNKSIIQTGLAIWAIALIFGLTKQSITYKMADDSYFNLKSVAKKTTNLKGRKLKLSSIKKIVKTYTKQKKSQDFFSQLNKKKTPIYFLNKLSNIPSSIKINITHLNISVKTKKLHVKGYSQDRLSSEKLKVYLKSLSINKKMTGNSVKKKHKTHFNYKINL